MNLFFSPLFDKFSHKTYWKFPSLFPPEKHKHSSRLHSNGDELVYREKVSKIFGISNTIIDARQQ